MGYQLGQDADRNLRHGLRADVDTDRETPAIDHRRSTERALAVAEFLRKVGLQGERIGVGGVGAGGERPAVESAKSRRVEIFVMGKRTPIVGWDTPAAGRF